MSSKRSPTSGTAACTRTARRRSASERSRPRPSGLVELKHLDARGGVGRSPQEGRRLNVRVGGGADRGADVVARPERGQVTPVVEQVVGLPGLARPVEGLAVLARVNGVRGVGG